MRKLNRRQIRNMLLQEVKRARLLKESAMPLPPDITEKIAAELNPMTAMAYAMRLTMELTNAGIPMPPTQPNDVLKAMEIAIKVATDMGLEKVVEILEENK